MKHGMQGVGVYWCVVEMLYEEGGYLPLEYERISFELRTEVRIIESVIRDFELFQFDENRFWSESVLERLQERCDRSEKARHSINKRWNKFSKHTNVIRTNNDSNTKKNSIVKNSIEKNIQKKFVIPSLEEIKTYCQERKNKIDAQYFFDYQTARDWKLKGGSKIRDWKAVIRTWEKNDFNTGGNNGQTNRTGTTPTPIITKEYVPEPYERPSDDQIERNIKRVQELVGKLAG